MKLSAGTFYIEKYGAAKGAERMAELGFFGLDVDLSDVENEFYAARDEEFIVKLLALKNSLAKFGVKALLARGPLPRKTYSDEERALTFEKTVKAMVAVRHLGGSSLTVAPIYFSEIAECDKALSAAREYYAALSEVAKGLGVTLCLENAANENPLSSFASLLSLVEKVASPSLRLSLSVAAANSAGENPAALVMEAGKLLSVVHAEDSLPNDVTPLPLFDGTVDWAALAEALFNEGYTGILSATAPAYPLGATPSEEEARALEGQSASYAKLIAD